MPASTKELIGAVKKGDRAAARRLVQKGADPNWSDGDGMTALMWAAKKGSRQLTAMLLELGASPNARDRQGQTALHHAVAGKHRVVVRTLASAAADLNAKDRDDCTPFDLAALAEDFATAKELVNLGAKGTPPDLGIISISQWRQGLEYLPIQEAIDLLVLRLSDLPEHNLWGEKGHLHVSFQIAAAAGKSIRPGIRKKAFSKKKRTMVVQVAVPKSLTKERPVEFLLDATQKAVDLAERAFKPARIDFPAGAIREHLQAIELMKNWEFPDFRE